jgi:TetR/AcrR family transcriptional regulator, transcriptional repressor of aconitase
MWDNARKRDSPPSKKLGNLNADTSMRPNSKRDLTANPGEGNSRLKKRGRPVGDHKAKSRELIEAARYVIAHHGYTAASLRKVAQHLGRTTGSVTYYFSSKNEMLVSVAESLFDEFNETLDKSSEEVDIQALFHNLTVWEKPQKKGAWLVFFHLLAHAATNPALASVFRRGNGQLRAKTAALIAQCQRQGAVRSDFSADLLADQLTAIVDGWFMYAPVERARFKPTRFNDLVRMSIAMLAPQAEPNRYAERELQPSRHRR